MKILVNAFLLFLLLMTAQFASAQIDTVKAKVDSAMRDPLKAGPKTITVKDTSAKLNGNPLKQEPAKKEVFKDSARLAIEAMPGRAAKRSAIVPGWGQITNGRWWKVPIIYSGLVGGALVFEFNNRYYREILHVLQHRVEPTKFPDEPKNYDKYTIYTETALKSAKDYYRRNRDLSVLAFFAFHTLNVIDAYVDAKFFRYDISDKLGVKLTPTLLMNQTPRYAMGSPVPAIKITIPL